MHELAIAEAVLGVALDHAGGRRIRSVELRVGRLRQVVPEALAFSFELVCQGTPAEGAELVLEEVPAEGDCRACRARSVLSTFPLRCERCGGLNVEIVRGEELCVDALEVTDAQPVLEEAT